MTLDDNDDNDDNDSDDDNDDDDDDDLGGRFVHITVVIEKKSGEKYRFGKWLDSRDDKARAGASRRHAHPPHAHAHPSHARGSAFR